MAMLRKVIPAGFRVLVKLKKVEEETLSKGGLIVAAHYGDNLARQQFATQEAHVMAIGDTAFKAYDEGKPWCKVGDLVMIAKYAGEDRKDIEEGEIYRIVNDGDIIAIFEGENV